MSKKNLLIVSVFAVLLFLFLRTTSARNLTTTATPTPTSTEINNETPKPLDEDILWDLIQEWRVENGHKAYVRDSRLCEIAEKRVKEIQSDYSHDSFEKADYSKLPDGKIAENISLWTAGEENTLNGWLDSPSHREALEKPYRSSCVVTGGEYGQSAVQVFASF